MEESLQAGHRLRGPHFSVVYEAAEGFVPLHLGMQSGDPSAQIDRPCAIIGRHSDADVRLETPEVSRRHCKLTFRDGFWRVQDLESLNGVFVNNEKVYEATLYDGDSLRVGEFIFRVTYLPNEERTPQEEMLKSIADVLPKAC